MQTMNIDIETYSSYDLLEVGVHKYVEAPDFQILMIAFCINDGPVHVVDMFSETAKDKNDLFTFMRFLQNPEVKKIAWNAAFERVCLNKAFDLNIPYHEWKCTMVQSYMLGLPGSLGQAGKVLKLPQDKQKDAKGKKLIKLFSNPIEPTVKNNKRTRNMPIHLPDEWKLFLEYCRQDVVTEMAIGKVLDQYETAESEWQLWYLDQKINDRGILVDKVFTERADELYNNYQKELEERAKQLTGLVNPNSLPQLKEWLKERTGNDYDSLAKDAVADILKETDDPVIHEVLSIKTELGKTSNSKYATINKSLCADDRLRGIFQFYGASRTGRWAGRRVQPHNLKQNKIKTLDMARDIVRSGNGHMLKTFYSDSQDVLSQLIRTSFVAPESHKLFVADFSAIEARVIAWLAGESWRMEVFQTHGKIYEASASQMFGIPFESIQKVSPERSKGKVAELALGYGGASGALINMGALDSGLTEDELPDLVRLWRQSSPMIVKFWDDVGAAAIEAVMNKGAVISIKGMQFFVEKNVLFIRLLSGRCLAYQNPRMGRNKFDKPALVYDGKNEKGAWGRIDTYGPKLVENIVQATARDFLAHSMIQLDAAGHALTMHVHDEIVEEGPTFINPDTFLEMVIQPMELLPDWGAGFPLKADGYHCDYYQKD